MKQSKSVEVALSEAVVRRFQHDATVTQLKDPKYPLRLRFSRGRTKASWHFVTYRHNQTYWRKVGTWPSLTVKAALACVPELSAQAAINPGDKLLSAEQFKTVADLLNWYEQRCSKLQSLSKHRKSTIKSVIKCHLLPMLGPLSYDDLTPTDVDDLFICPLQQDRSLATVRLAFVVLKAAFNQAKKQKRISVNPMSEMVFSDFIIDSVVARDGAIKPMMLPELLNRLSEQTIRIQMFVALLLGFATRIGETRLARWDQFDFNKRTWTIPKENTKTRQTHELPLSEQFIRLLSAYRKQQQSIGYRGLYLFPGQKPKRSICESTASKLIKQFSESAFSAHDFRKLARSIWADLSIDYMVGERLLNHSLSKLDEAYFQTLISGPKRDAIEQYHKHLDDLGFTEFHTDPLPRSFVKSCSVNPNSQAA